MLKSELIHLITPFSKAEMRKAEQFLKSPYHNANRTALALFKYIRRFYPELNSFKLDRKHVYPHLYPREAFNEKRLRNQMWKLKKLLEQFLLHEQLQREDHIQDQLLVKACFRKLNYEEFAALIQRCVSDLEKPGFRDSEFYQKRLWFYEELYYHPDRGMYQTDQYSVLAIIQDLERYYALSKLRFETDQEVRKAVIDETTSSTIELQPLLEAFGQMQPENELIKLYLQLYNFRQAPLSAGEFSAAIDQLTRHFGLMGEKEKAYLVSAFINTGVYYHNRGDKQFTALVARLYKIAEEQEVISYRDKIQASTFLNAVLLCSAAGELVWAKDFIKKYGSCLAPHDRNYTINLALGYWYFLNSRQLPDQRQEMLRQAHEHLSQIPYSGLVIDLRLRSLQLRVYYELELIRGNVSVFLNFAEAFEKWLMRDPRLAQERNKAYLNFVRLSKQLVKFTEQEASSAEQLDQFIAKVNKKKPIILKDWIIEKAEELK